MFYSGKVVSITYSITYSSICSVFYYDTCKSQIVLICYSRMKISVTDVLCTFQFSVLANEYRQVIFNGNDYPTFWMEKKTFFRMTGHVELGSKDHSETVL